MSNDGRNQNGDLEKNLVFDDEKKVLLKHNYDGIEEFDHPLPGWWLATFYGTIVFSVIYCGYYLTGVGPTLREEMNQGLAAIESLRPKAPVGAEGDSVLVAAILKDPTRLAGGKKVYDEKCAACHRPDGGGSIGPNLTDGNWIHGAKVADMTRVIRDGILDKGMPPWGQILSSEEMGSVQAYIYSLHGTNPANPKAPQGEPAEIEQL